MSRLFGKSVNIKKMQKKSHEYMKGQLAQQFLMETKRRQMKDLSEFMGTGRVLKFK